RPRPRRGRGATRARARRRRDRPPRRARGRAPERRASAATHLVDADGAGEDERVVLAGADLDPVGVAHPEPALRDLGHLVAVPLELVFMLDDVALRLEVGATLHLDRVAVAKR